jgi:hypothetical protein
MLWMLSNAAIGLYNIFHYSPSAFKGLSPHYIYYFWQVGPLPLVGTPWRAGMAQLLHAHKPFSWMLKVCLPTPGLTQYLPASMPGALATCQQSGH